MDIPVFMEKPPGVDVGNDTNKQAYVIEVKSLLYGLKQSSSNCYDCPKKGLERQDFTESKADPCVFLKKGMIISTYADDRI